MLINLKSLIEKVLFEIPNGPEKQTAKEKILFIISDIVSETIKYMQSNPTEAQKFNLSQEVKEKIEKIDV